MIRLIYTPRSLHDFDRILERINLDNPAAAVQLGEDIIKTCELLEQHPLLGEVQDDLSPGLRRFICRGYGIYYLPIEADDVLYVVRILPPRLNIVPELFR